MHLKHMHGERTERRPKTWKQGEAGGLRSELERWGGSSKLGPNFQNVQRWLG
jgi:hypothetical protein